MTFDQFNGQLRQWVPIISTAIAVTGLLKPSEVAVLSDAVLQIVNGAGIIVGGAGIIGGMVLAWRATSKAAIVAAATKPENVAATVRAVTQAAPETTPAIVSAVNNLPDVKGVITSPTPEGDALAKSIPSPTVVRAGTEAAKAVAGSPSPYTHGGHP